MLEERVGIEPTYKGFADLEVVPLTLLFSVPPRQPLLAFIGQAQAFPAGFPEADLIGQLGPEHIRQYQAALFTRCKLAPNTVTQRLAALRFFYVQVLKRGGSVAEAPYPKKVLHLPQVLSPEEVARLIDAATLSNRERPSGFRQAEAG
jgi:hypothetical protein